MQSPNRRLLIVMLCALLPGVLLLAACSGPESTSGASGETPAAADVGTGTGTGTNARVATIVRPTEPAQTPQPDDESSESDAATTEAEMLAALDAEGLAFEVAELVNGLPGFVEVVLATPDGGTLFAANASEQLEAASLYKLGVMVEVFRQRDSGLLTFDEEVVIDAGFLSEGSDAISEVDIGSAFTIDTLLMNMIDLSSNVAATALLWRVGTDNVNTTLADLGLVATEIRWYPAVWSDDGGTPSDDGGDDGDGGDGGGEDVVPEEPATEVAPPSGQHAAPGAAVLLSAPAAWHADLRADLSFNVTSAEDVAALFGMLARGEVVSAESSVAMLDLLRGQVLNDRLPAYLPAEAEVAHKTGNLEGLSHDAGIIYTPAGPIIVVVLTEDLDDETANAVMAQIGLSVWTHAGGS